jgi:glyoxylase-like metal-dependent hydrolase (beta-lactamase superfamily II)
MHGGRWQIGDVTITRIVEIEATGGMSRILPQATREEVAKIPWLYPHFADDTGRMRGSIHSFVVDTPDRRIVIDTCIGNDKERSVPAWNMLQTRFLDDMAAAGYPVDSIDTVLCTHLHVDHVGWNTRLVDGRWVPTFDRARYLMGEIEFEHWSTESGHDGQARVMADSVLPVWEAGLVDLIPTDHAICAEINLVPTPGHTPGHVSVMIRSRGEEAIITGDFLHHPCQMARPHWTAAPDSDPEQAIRTRRAMFERLADGPVLVIGTHFATPSAGHLKRDGDAWRLDV